MLNGGFQSTPANAANSGLHAGQFSRTIAFGSLAFKAIAYCMVSLCILGIVVFAMFSHQIEYQSRQYREQLLREKAAVLIQQHAKANVNSIALPASSIPIYYHWGSHQSAAKTEHWPAGCIQNAQLLTSESNHLALDIRCAEGSLSVYQTQLLSASDKKQSVTLWIYDKGMFGLNGFGLSDWMGMICLWVLLACIAGRWMTRAVTMPLSRVSESAKQMANGDYNLRLVEGSIGEVNQLVSSFNRMAKSLLERETTIRRTVYKDQLTGLDNRAYLCLSFQDRAMRAREPLTLFTWSVDNFDSINEVLGHEVAERVLIKTAKRARRFCKDHLVIARLEGNLFCILMPKSAYMQHQHSGLLRRLLQGTVRVGAHAFELECHAGVAHYPDHGDNPDVLLRHSVIARQLAFKTRQAVIEFEQRMEQRTINRLSLIAELRNAITLQQFELFFQPKLNLKSYRISQAEALIRWRHPTRGMVGPGSFIELAEQTGLMRQITCWVVSEVYRLVPDFLPQDIRLSMNLSMVDLEDQFVMEFIKNLHAEMPYAAPCITMEITESTAMRDPENVLDRLNELALMGFQIAIDDFGAGYSSLSYLKRFPVSELKIDRSLVQGVDLDRDGQIILESTIQMGHIMGLVVTTEGVEREGEFETIRNLGADYVQGYWLAKPMPYDDFKEKHLKSNSHSSMDSQSLGEFESTQRESKQGKKKKATVVLNNRDS